MSRYGLVGGSTGELLSYGGRVIVHNAKHEMEFLFPNSRVVRISDGDLGGPVMQLRDHPALGQVRFPLQKSDFPGQ